MFYVLGLGNPGDEYVGSRHNVGREIVEAFVKKQKLGDFDFNKNSNSLVVEGKVGKEKLIAILPETYMNKSGAAVKKFVTSRKKAETLIVVHDDLDLPLGKMKLVKSRGSGGHKGVESIKKNLGTNDFMRLRIGIARSDSKGRAKNISGEEAVKKFVLGKLTPSESKEFKKVEKKSIEAISHILKEGFYKAQNVYNQ